MGRDGGPVGGAGRVSVRPSRWASARQKLREEAGAGHRHSRIISCSLTAQDWTTGSKCGQKGRDPRTESKGAPAERLRAEEEPGSAQRKPEGRGQPGEWDIRAR